jgi:hypothetical protein
MAASLCGLNPHCLLGVVEQRYDPFSGSGVADVPCRPDGGAADLRIKIGRVFG